MAVAGGLLGGLEGLIRAVARGKTMLVVGILAIVLLALMGKLTAMAGLSSGDGWLAFGIIAIAVVVLGAIFLRR